MPVIANVPNIASIARKEIRVGRVARQTLNFPNKGEKLLGVCVT